MTARPPVHFIGAGPGDPELLTIKGRRFLGEADLVIWADSLINPAILGHAREGAEVRGSSDMRLEEITGLIKEAVAAGRKVARLHTGDPSLYGALAEQLAILEAEGIPYRIVPGVTSLSASAAAVRSELTVPGGAQTVIVTRGRGRTPVPDRESLAGLAAHGATMAVFLSASLAEAVQEELLAGGYLPDTPAAVVYRATWEDEQVLRCPLGELASRIRSEGIARHALILVGEAVKERDGTAPRSHLYGDWQSERGDGGASGEGGTGTCATRPEGAAGAIGTSGAGGITGDGGAAGAEPGPGTWTGSTAVVSRQAVVAVSRKGAGLALRIATGLGSTAAVYLPERYRDETARADVDHGRNPDPAVIYYEQPCRDLVTELFRQADRIVLCMAVGAAVRLIAPSLSDKRRDPGVVAVDDEGLHAVSLLSGHLGGANELAHKVAGILGARPVITTASDLAGLPALDTWPRKLGWKLEPGSDLTGVTAALVNGERVALVEEGAGCRWPEGIPLPPNIIRLSGLPGGAVQADMVGPAGLKGLAGEECPAAVIISDREIPGDGGLTGNGGNEGLSLRAGLPGGLPRHLVVFRPPTLAVGIGCRKETGEGSIRTAVAETLAGAGLSRLSIGAVGTLKEKEGEAGLTAFCRGMGVPLLCFEGEALNRAWEDELGRESPDPSSPPVRYMGVAGVCEPAAFLAGLHLDGFGSGHYSVPERQVPPIPTGKARPELIVPKRKLGPVTVAVARTAGGTGADVRGDGAIAAAVSPGRVGEPEEESNAG
ncbi:MAG: precorrin-4 C(11)-methyltransferase [Firmicutes bacterium]|nr:precorrin-4 C(11)-methyltransferase [Bacillota bacterium]